MLVTRSPNCNGNDRLFLSECCWEDGPSSGLPEKVDGDVIAIKDELCGFHKWAQAESRRGADDGNRSTDEELRCLEEVPGRMRGLGLLGGV